MQGSYNYWLVTLSYLIAVAASYTALELGRRVSRTTGLAAIIWLNCGAVSMGIGIWTMHFIGMLAFTLPMPFNYDIPLTILSLMVGMAAAGFAIFVASRERQGFAKIGLSGLLLGGGIAAMHYTGMAAMEMEAAITYDTTLLALSVVIAVVAACAAIWIIFTLANFTGRHLALLKVGAAMIMGVAICGMHYTGMAAAVYTPMEHVVQHTATVDTTMMAIAVGGVALVILGVTHLTIFFDYRIGVERKHAEKADQEAVRLSEVLDEATNEIYMFDSESLAFVKLNKGAAENLGYSMDELRVMTPVDIKPEYDVAAFCELLKPLRHGTRKELLLDTVHLRKDGSEYQVQVHLQLSRVTEPPLFVAMVTDVTDRKALESELMQAKKLESIGQLAAGIAHEINTPAQFVGDNTRFIKDAFKDLLELNSAYARLLRAATDGEISPELIQEVNASSETADVEYLAEEIPSAIDQSLDGITRISNIVRAMKEFSHPGSKDQESADLNQAIQNTITVASNEWKYVADVETKLAENLPPVTCFIQEINQVVLNLIVNAAHAIDQSKAEGSDEKGTITISTRDLGEDIEIKVTDTGGGVPEEIRDRIFDPFFTTKEVGKGTGQGLAMAYRTIVEQHHGKIWVDSVNGQGSTFNIVLPYKPKDVANEDPADEGVAA